MPRPPAPVAAILSIIPVVDTTKDRQRHTYEPDQEDNDIHEQEPARGGTTRYALPVVPDGLVVLLGQGTRAAGVGCGTVELDILEVAVRVVVGGWRLGRLPGGSVL